MRLFPAPDKMNLLTTTSASLIPYFPKGVVPDGHVYKVIAPATHLSSVDPSTPPLPFPPPARPRFLPLHCPRILLSSFLACFFHAPPRDDFPIQPNLTPYKRNHTQFYAPVHIRPVPVHYNPLEAFPIRPASLTIKPHTPPSTERPTVPQDLSHLQPFTQ